MSKVTLYGAEFPAEAYLLYRDYYAEEHKPLDVAWTDHPWALMKEPSQEGPSYEIDDDVAEAEKRAFEQYPNIVPIGFYGIQRCSARPVGNRV